MTTSVAIIEGPLPPLDEGVREPTAHDVGAVLIFEGVVRADEGGRQLTALRYEAYLPMALRQLELLAGETARKHGLAGLAVWHSVGRVPVGGVSLRVVVRSGHRAEALAAMGEFVTLLKRDVPIWKHPEWDQMP
jgi:molybdopterin synthase catalytic subunit